MNNSEKRIIEGEPMIMMRKLFKDESGLETVEYAVMTALIVAALVGAVTALSGAISTRFTGVEGTITAIK